MPTWSGSARRRRSTVALDLHISTDVELELSELAEKLVEEEESVVAEFLGHIVSVGSKKLGKTTRLVPDLIGEELADQTGDDPGKIEAFFLDLLCGFWRVEEKNEEELKANIQALVADIVKRQDKG